MYKAKILGIYDNQGLTFDQYTLLLEHPYSGIEVYTLSKHQGPQGFNQYAGTFSALSTKGMGNRTYLKYLPKEVVKAIRKRQIEPK